MKELLVISQDTSAYGVDVKYRTGFWDGRPVKTQMTELCRAGRTRARAWRLGAPALRLSVSARRRGDAADGDRQDPAVPRRAVPAREPAHPQADEAPGERARRTLERIRAWREICPELTIRSTFIVGFPGETEAEFEDLLDFLDEAQLDRVGCFAYSPVDGAMANALPDPCPRRCARSAARASWRRRRGSARRGCSARSARRSTVLVDGAPKAPHRALERRCARNRRRRAY